MYCGAIRFTVARQIRSMEIPHLRFDFFTGLLRFNTIDRSFRTCTGLRIISGADYTAGTVRLSEAVSIFANAIWRVGTVFNMLSKFAFLFLGTGANTHLIGGGQQRAFESAGGGAVMGGTTKAFTRIFYALSGPANLSRMAVIVAGAPITLASLALAVIAYYSTAPTI